MKSKEQKIASVLVCSGVDCAKRVAANRKLIDALSCNHSVEMVRCQKICRGPVIGLKLDGSWEWFEKVTRGADRAHVLRSVARGKFTKQLKKHRVKKRSGKRR